MSDQEMQFADPDWKPTQPLEKKTSSQEQEAFIPQPINADLLKQSQWRTVPPSPPEQEGYTGIPPYAGSAPQQMQRGDFRQRQYRRRGRGPWFWIILAIIIISLASGGFGSFNGPRFGPNPFNHKPIAPRDFTVNGQPTIVINDANGAVQVNVGPPNSDVFIQASTGGNFFGNSNDIQVNYSQDGNTINANVQDGQQGPVDLIVTVPQDANLKLITDSGGINVDGVVGQMTLKTNSGSIEATHDVITGSSTLTSNTGGITFGGSIGAGGTYQFLTNSGTVDLTVPASPGFHLNASTTSGVISPNDFPNVSVQKNISGSGDKVSGNVGVSSQNQGANVTINTDSGDINLHQG